MKRPTYPPPPRPPREGASVYATKKFICILTSSGYRATGLDRHIAPIYLDPDSSDRELGEAVNAALNAFHWFQPCDFSSRQEFIQYSSTRAMDGDDLAEWERRTMEKYGYKSLRYFRRPMMNVPIRRDAGTISMEPTRQTRPQGWQGLMTTKDFSENVAADADVAEIGAALRRCLAKCNP